MPTAAPRPRNLFRCPGWLLDSLITICIFFLYAGTPAPSVNESHYLTKAKHAWDPGFGIGDQFLESGDAHWFFFLTFGWLTNFLSLAEVAWIGRWVSWSLLAVGWCKLARQCLPWTLAGTTTSLGFIAAIHFGHLSGEWVIGGFEAKCLTYACVFVALAEIASNRWNRSWIWLGLGSAFHVVTGGWVVLTVMMSYALVRWLPNSTASIHSEQPLRQQWPGLFIGGAIALLGLVPAVNLNAGSSVEIQNLGAWIYVYVRLPHHLAFTHFASERFLNFGGLIFVVLFAVWLYRCSRRAQGRASLAPLLDINVGLPRLWCIALSAGLLAVVGALLDAAIGTQQEVVAAQWLRYYWFRWNDVIWPIILAVTLGATISNWEVNVLYEQSIFSRRRLIGYVAIFMLLIPGGGLLCYRFAAGYDEIIPDADQQTLLLKSEPKWMQALTYRDWIAACGWIRRNTDTEGLWLTPRYQQTFKWYAQRSELICWKDSPQDAVGLVEWWDRIQDVYQYEDGLLQAFTDSDIDRLRSKYTGLRYVIVDRRVEGAPLRLPLVYPVGKEENETFWIFELTK